MTNRQCSECKRTKNRGVLTSWNGTSQSPVIVGTRFNASKANEIVVLTENYQGS